MQREERGRRQRGQLGARESHPGEGEAAGEIAAAGSNVLVAGSAVYGAKDYRAAISRIREAALSGRHPR